MWPVKPSDKVLTTLSLLQEKYAHRLEQLDDMHESVVRRLQRAEAALRSEIKILEHKLRFLRGTMEEEFGVLGATTSTPTRRRGKDLEPLNEMWGYEVASLRGDLVKEMREILPHTPESYSRLNEFITILESVVEEHVHIRELTPNYARETEDLIRERRDQLQQVVETMHRIKDEQLARRKEAQEKIGEVQETKVDVVARAENSFAAAIERGDDAAVTVFIKAQWFWERHHFVNRTNAVGLRPLHIACKAGHRPIVELLLSYGADFQLFSVDIDTSSPGYPALFWAAQGGFAEIVELLLQRGADPNVRCAYGRTPMHTAAYHGHVDVIRVLLRYGASPNVRTNENEDPLVTPLLCAVHLGRAEAAELLINAGADVNVRSVAGEGLIDMAVIAGHSEIVRLLLQYTARTKRADFLRWKEMALQRHHDGVLQVLAQYTERLEPTLAAVAADERPEEGEEVGDRNTPVAAEINHPL